MTDSSMHNDVDETTLVPETTLYPKITGKLEEVEYHLLRGTETRRILPVTGTCTLHGTHFDLLITPEDIIHFQSRNRLSITPEADNAGSAKFMINHKRSILELKAAYLARYRELNPSTRIEPSSPLIISIYINNSWQPDKHYSDIEARASRIFNISRGGYYHSFVDFDDIPGSMARLHKISNQVDAECPFALSFGIRGIGEGIVWKFDHRPGNSNLWLKTKGPNFATTRIRRPEGEKAAEVSRAHALADGKAGEFAMRVATERRMEQGLEYLAEFGHEKNNWSMNIFASWVVEDVEKEEVLEIGGEGLGGSLERQLIRKNVKKLAFAWFKDELAGKHEMEEG